MILALMLRTWQAELADPRLDKPIAIAEYSMPAPRVCADLCRLAGIPISCDPSLQVDMMVLVVRHRAVKEIMAKIAALFDWEWVRDGDGYRLEPTPRFAHLARFGRHEALVEEAKRRQLAAKAFLDRYSNPAAVTDRMKELQAQTSNPHPLLTRFGIPQYSEDMNQLLPEARVAIAQVASMSAEDLASAEDRRIVFSCTPGPLEKGLDPSAAKLVRSLPKEIRLGPYVTTEGPRVADARPASAIVQIDSVDRAGVKILNSEGRVLTDLSVDLPGRTSNFATLPTDLEKEVLDRPNPPLPKAAPPDNVSYSDPDFSRYFAGVGITLGKDVVSDDFAPYFEVLGDRSSDISWLRNFQSVGFNPVVQGGWLVNRNPTWPCLREGAIPRQWLLDFGEAKRHGTIEEQAAIASRFTAPQLRSPGLKWGGPSEREYWFFRFWSNLSPALRETLMSGKQLRLGDLPETVIEYLYRTGERPHRLGTRYYYRMADALGGESVFDEPEFDSPVTVLDPYETGASPRYEALPYVGDFADAYPARAGPSSLVQMQVVDVPGIAEDGFTLCPSRLNGRFPSNLNRANVLQLARIRAYRLHISLGPGFEAWVDLSETTLGGRISPDRSTWPKELRDRLAR